MKKILFSLSLLICAAAFGQSESNDFIVKDTTFTESGGSKWHILVRVPRYYDTPNHADTARRPGFIFIGGLGQVSTDSTTRAGHARAYGPMYQYLSGGWDGGVQLANGKHYPILINIVPSYVNPRGPATTQIITFLKNRYRLKDIHGAGFSMGGATWGIAIAYEASPGAGTFMKLVKSVVFMQGQSAETFAPYNAWTQGYDAFGTWAQTYGGRAFCLEGVGDGRDVWKVSTKMNARVPGSAYYAMENIGGGGHCCWNEMMNPFRQNWKNTRFDLGDNIAWNTIPEKNNTMGTYINGSNIFQWMLRQGDTTLVGSGGGGGPTLPQAIAGADQTITLPTSTASLNGSASTNATTYAWTKVSGPSGGSFNNASIASPTVSGLIAGTYVFKLTVSDGTNTSEDLISITVVNASNTPPVVSAGVDQTITLPAGSLTASVTLVGSITDNGTASGEWSKVDGPNEPNFSDKNNSTTQVLNLLPGTYIFRLKATDNDNVTAADETTVTVIDPNTTPAARIQVRFWNPKIAGSSAVDPGQWQNIDPTGSVTTINRALLTTTGANSGITMSMTFGNSVSDNGSEYKAWNTSKEIVWLDGLLRFTTAYAGSRTLTFSGLKTNATYDLYLLASRVNSANSTDFTVGETTKRIAVGNNKDSTASFTSLSAPNGTLVVTLNRVGSGYTHLNGFILVEQGVGPQPNRAPIVSLPSAVTVQLPATSVQLPGSGFDPDGDPLAYLWSTPGAGTFSHPDSNITTISGLTQGTHVAYLTASDGELSDVKMITITVNPAGNTPPVVNAGADQTLTYVSPAFETQTQVLGTATDNSGIASLKWEFISGPSVYTIVNPTLLSTEIKNLVGGAYRFRLVATDNQGASTADTIAINITLMPPVTNTGWGVGIAEYNSYFIEPGTGFLYGVGNKSNDGGGSTTGTTGKPVRVAGAARDEPMDTVVGGLHGGAAISRTRRVWTMGDGDDGQRGNGSFSNSILYPTMIETDSLGRPFTNVATICAGFLYIAGGTPIQSNFFVATKYDGTGWIWGRVIGGLLANGTDSAVEYVMKPHQLQLPGGRLFRKLIAGNTMMAWATDGTVWTCGRTTNYANLGYKGSGFDYRSWHQVTVPGSAPVTDIAGAGTFNYILTDEMLYGFGAAGNYLGLGTATTGAGTPVPEPIALTNIWNALPGKIAQIVVTYAVTHVILDNQRMFSWGEQSMSGVGNGKSLNWVTYGWSLPGGEVRFFQKQPIEATPGKKWRKVWGGNTYVYHSIAEDINGDLWGCGRNKAGVLPIRAALATGEINQYIQNGLDLRYWTKLRDPRSTDSVYAVTAPTCVPERGSPINSNQTAACATFTNGSATPPVANAGADRTVTSSMFVLDGSASADANGILILPEWEAVDGPVSIISTPGDKQTEVYVSSNGVYRFRFKAENNRRYVRYDTVAITVNLNGNQLPTASINTISNSFEITLPTNEIELNGVGTDIDGTIVKYTWTKVAGTTAGTIATPAAAKTKITGFTAAGLYTYQLEVEDDKGAKAQTQATITVKAAPVVQPNNPAKYLPKRNHVGLKGVKY